MLKNVVFLNIVHNSFDDRTFYHHARALVENGYNVTIISTLDNTVQQKDGIGIHSFDGNKLSRKDKINEAAKLINIYQPEIIICDSPLAVYASARYKKKNRRVQIIYDVTEWYPSKKNFRDTYGLKKILKFIVLFLFNFYAGIRTNKFIFGEYHKSIPFKIFFWKKRIELPYYPDLKYIKVYPLQDLAEGIKILYSGKMNAEKGLFDVLNVVHNLAIKHHTQKITLNLIGSFSEETDKIEFDNKINNFPKNVSINIADQLPFEEYCKIIGDNHIFFDLRKIDFENNHCLPIKIFYYLACGRPVIYSDLKATRRLTENYNFVTLVNPQNTDSIVSKISEYISHPDKYYSDCQNAGKISKGKFNWDLIKNDFLEFIAN